MRTVIVALMAVLPAWVAMAASDGSAVPVRALVAPDTSAEALTLQAIDEYHEVLNNAARQRAGFGLGPVGGGRPESCRGSTLQECFGGDMHCAWWGRMCDATFHAVDRAELLARLEALQARFPESDFVVGQLVDFALKDGDPVRALDAAERCRATAWWCQALRGYAMHAGVPGSGDLRFNSALASAPDDALAFGFDPDPIVPDRGLHCEWTHAGRLWPDGLPDEWDAGACEARPDLHARFWWLADPLWSVPGNARRGEHISRNLAARLMYDLGWHEMEPARARVWWWAPFSLHDEWTRNGFYNSWRTIVRIHQARLDTTHQLYVYGGYSFAPDADRFVRPEASTAEDWAVVWNNGPERMTWGGSWHPITDHQTAVLRRGETLMAVTAARLPVLVSSFEDVDAALAMGRPSDLTIETTSAGVDATGVVRARLPLQTGSWVASLETRGPGWTGRARFGAPAPSLEDGVGVSRPLLVAAGSDAPSDSLEQELLPSTTLTPDRVGVYFELYGVESGQSMEMELSIERTDRSLLGRLGGLLGVSRPSTMAVAWTESADPPREGGYLPRLTGVDLSRLAPGTYSLEVRAVLDARFSVSASTPIRLRDED